MEPPIFDEDSIAEQERIMLEARLRRQEAFFRGDGYPELSLAISDPNPAAVVASDLIWDHEVEKPTTKITNGRFHFSLFF